MLLSDLPGYAPKGSSSVKPVLTLAELDARFRSWLVDIYHHRIHVETGQVPADRWQVGGLLPRLPESLERLDLLLLKVAESGRVRRNGIRFQSYQYLDVTLAAFVREDVTIRYDPRDLAEIRGYHERAFLCRAVCPELAGEMVSLKEIASARDSTRREVKAELRDRQAVAEELLGLRRNVLASEDPEPKPQACGASGRRARKPP